MRIYWRGGGMLDLVKVPTRASEGQFLRGLVPMRARQAAAGGMCVATARWTMSLSA